MLVLGDQLKSSPLLAPIDLEHIVPTNVWDPAFAIETERWSHDRRDLCSPSLSTNPVLCFESHVAQEREEYHPDFRGLQN